MKTHCVQERGLQLPVQTHSEGGLPREFEPIRSTPAPPQRPV